MFGAAGWSVLKLYKHCSDVLVSSDPANYYMPYYAMRVRCMLFHTTFWASTCRMVFIYHTKHSHSHRFMSWCFHVACSKAITISPQCTTVPWPGFVQSSGKLWSYSSIPTVPSKHASQSWLSKQTLLLVVACFMLSDAKHTHTQRFHISVQWRFTLLPFIPPFPFNNTYSNTTIPHICAVQDSLSFHTFLHVHSTIHTIPLLTTT
jgi:hypothetical protein